MTLTNITRKSVFVRWQSDILERRVVKYIIKDGKDGFVRFTDSTCLFRLSDIHLDVRSETAQKLHTYIIGTIKGKEHLDPQKVKEIIIKNPNSLLELSINNCSHLQDIIHIGAENKLDSDLIRENAHCLFQEIRHFFPKKIGEVLLNRTKDGFTLLQDAVKNGKENIISMVMSWYQVAD